MKEDPIVSVAMYQFIVDYKSSHDGNSPTYREIQDGLGVNSLNTVHMYIHGMIDAGLLTIINRKMCVRDGAWTLEG
jgi:hypothetical protein